MPKSGVPVRVIRTVVPGFRTVGNQAVAEFAGAVEYLSDLVAPDGETEMWTTTKHRVVGAARRVRPRGRALRVLSQRHVREAGGDDLTELVDVSATPTTAPRRGRVTELDREVATR